MNAWNLYWKLMAAFCEQMHMKREPHKKQDIGPYKPESTFAESLESVSVKIKQPLKVVK